MLIDTNILVYAVNADSPKNRRAQIFLKKHIDNSVLAHQNIFEALRVLTHPRFSHPMKLVEAQNSILTIADACRIICPNSKTPYLALELIKINNLFGNRIFDAYLAATAISNDITKIATDNEKDFKKFGIDVYNPFKEVN